MLGVLALGWPRTRLFLVDAALDCQGLGWIDLISGLF